MCVRERERQMNGHATGFVRRRQVLLGLGASTLAACAGNGAPSDTPRFAGPKDPLAQFRIYADGTPEDWMAHMHAPQAGDAPGGPNVLALLGGGEDGAFGAGALAGWSARGDRPDFDLVTGISTGALIAPFAFMGSDYDSVLRSVFTESDASDVMRLRPFQAMFSDALYDTTPLARLIKQHTPPAFLRAVGARHAAGNSLLVVTSELETARASVWDMGAIAQAGHYNLFRGIMRASSALPGLFSPVDLRYQAGGETYTETHVDGGVHMQFLAVPDFAFTAPGEKLEGGHIYVLINNTLNPAPVKVSRTPLSISQQALTTSGRASALLAVNATQLFAQKNGLGFSVASIDPAADIVYDPSDRFSSVYMNALYAHGMERASERRLWKNS